MPQASLDEVKTADEDTILTVATHLPAEAAEVSSWEAYRDVPRLGRKTRLPEKQRAILWSIFERVRTT